jgi:hypothetical protein
LRAEKKKTAGQETSRGEKGRGVGLQLDGYECQVPASGRRVVASPEEESEMKPSIAKGLFAFILAMGLVAASPSMPSEADGKKAFEGFLEKSLISHHAEVAAFRKTNGITRELNGQKIYEMEFESTIRVTKTWPPQPSPTGATFLPIGGWENVKIVNGQLQPGQELSGKGTIPFELTENGWRVRRY